MSGRQITQSREAASACFDCERFARLARCAFPASTGYYLSRLTGIPARTVEKHLRGETKPSADHLLAYLAAGTFGQRLQALLLPDRQCGAAEDHFSLSLLPCGIPTAAGEAGTPARPQPRTTGGGAHDCRPADRQSEDCESG